MSKENRSLLLSIIGSLDVKVNIEDITVAQNKADFALVRNKLKKRSDF